VTICTEGRAHLFGDIIDDEMVCSLAGKMVSARWTEIPSQFPGIMVDAWVTMPNHVHALIGIGLEYPEQPHASLSDVLQWYKSITTMLYIRGVRSGGWPRVDGQLWQVGFHDHIVRDDRDLDRIRTYIEENPARWKQDTFAP